MTTRSVSERKKGDAGFWIRGYHTALCGVGWNAIFCGNDIPESVLSGDCARREVGCDCRTTPPSMFLCAMQDSFRPRTLHLLRVTWFHFYDDLGRNLLVNFLAVTAFFVPLPILGIPVSICAICAYANSLVRFEDPPASRFITEYRRYFRRGLGYGWSYLAVCVPLGFSFGFYLHHNKEWGLWGYLLAGICFWSLVFYLAMGFYFFPLLVHQREGFLLMMKRSALAVLLGPGYVWIGMSVWLLWVAICCIFPPLLLIVPVIWAAITANAALLLLLNEYRDEVPDV
ncbi:MAG TPA: hypothetical protein PLQ35_05195 [bacterium]|nr:hypothetical protein [bacterium]